MSDLRLPLGNLRTFEDGLLTVRLPPGRVPRARVQAWLERLRALKSRLLLAPRRVTDRPAGPEAEYPDESRQTVPLTTKAAQWAADPRAAVPEVLSLAHFVLTIAEELAGPNGRGVPLGPVSVRFLPGAPTPWRLLAIPVEEATLAEWAQADPDVWRWMTPGALFGERSPDGVRTAGLALHLGLIGAPLPEHLTRSEQFRRVLAGRAGASARLETAVRSALPAACAAEATAVAALIRDCLSLSAGKRPTVGGVRERLEEWQANFTAERLSRHWEIEGQTDLAAKLRKPTAPPEPPETPEPEPAPPGVCWSDTARQRREAGQWQEALDAAWNAIRSEGPHHTRLYLSILQEFVARTPRPVEQATAAFERLKQAFGTKLDESDLLRVVHLRLRYLAPAEDPSGQLERRFESRWNDGIAFLLRAGLLIRKGEAFGQVSRLCKEGRTRFEAMPEGGGDAGGYARAYLDLLDGVAHVGFVGANRALDYYADALDCFSRCFVRAHRLNATDLVQACLRWFGWLARLTQGAKGPPLAQVYLGVQAILHSQGLLAEALSGSGLPDIPPYDEARLFPL